MERMRDGDELTVQVHGADGAPELLWVLALVAPGMVQVREWTPATWSGAPTERVLPADEVYARVRRAHDQRRRVSVELAELRAWLDGTRR
ncbi:MAG TPA: hypothetical protein VFS05_13755 [Gemmatimonadaceae bacterium]|nr:hypothetical protein [Gemmatimonadaceae bacterium]